MTSVKIFVSHRKDMDSKTINNPLYVNVICGQVFTTPKEGKIGDNTGDNISNKSPYYSEFTVQYWAWKNQKADYYGLCHYRRYLSFAEKMYPEWNEQRFAFEKKMNQKSVRKYGLLNYKKQKEEIKKYDLITSVTYEVKNIPNIPKFKNVVEAFAESPALFTSYESIELLKKIVKKRFPIYYECLISELNSERHRGFNCFIMKKELFYKMCTFQFDVLFDIEKKLDLNNRAGNNVRELGYLGEILYGTFIRWVIEQKIYRVKETQIVLYWDTNKTSQQSKIKNMYHKILAKIKNIQIFSKTQKLNTLIALMQQQNNQILQFSYKLNYIQEKLDKTIQKHNLLFFSLPRDFSDDLDTKKLTFWKSYPKATGDLKIIQDANAMLLKNLKKICDKLSCKFWLHGGSLVGALRHNGFVPWDDDIDIAMMRDDFIKIKTYLQKSPIYEVQNNYYIQIGCRSYRFRRKDIESNCFVDIFVYDNYSLRYNDILTDWQNLCYQKKRIIASSMELVKELNVYPQEPTLKGFDKLRKNLDILFDSYIAHNASKVNNNYILWNLDNNYENETRYAWHHGRIFKKDEIFPLKKTIFEGIECNIPSNYEKYTFAEYGIRYLDMPNNIGESIHWNEFFSDKKQLLLAKKIINDGIVN